MVELQRTVRRRILVSNGLVTVNGLMVDEVVMMSGTLQIVSSK